MSGRDPEKARAYRRRYNRSEKGLAKDRQRMRRRYREHKARVDAIKLASGCVDCPPNLRYKHPVWALHFDHLRDKRFRISNELQRAWPIVEAEIAKCVVRCAPHHAEATRSPNHYRKDRPTLVQVSLFEAVYGQESLFG